MVQIFKKLLFSFMCITMSYAAELLRNPDFENPPANATSQPLLLTEANSIPGWSFSGTVYYITYGSNLSFPGNGHAIQLGENGKINQTFESIDDFSYYILSFTILVQNENCANINNHSTAVNVSVQDRSVVFLFERNLSRNLWESYGFYMGGWGRGDFVNLEIKSVTITNSDHINGTCWPVVDAFTVRRNGVPRWYEGNILSNGGFEVGPSFLKNSSEGILLNEEQDMFESPLEQWSILGTIKYIDSKHYKVPQGKAAIQLLSGAPSGIQIDLKLRMALTYTLNFTIGDANDSCVGDFIVYVQIGLNVHNFTMWSNGTGSAYNHSIRFKAESSRESTSMSFYSFNETRRNDGVICGPVLDNIVLVVSYGQRIGLCNGVLIFSLIVVWLYL